MRFYILQHDFYSIVQPASSVSPPRAVCAMRGDLRHEEQRPVTTRGAVEVAADGGLARPCLSSGFCHSGCQQSSFSNGTVVNDVANGEAASYSRAPACAMPELLYDSDTLNAPLAPLPTLPPPLLLPSSDVGSAVRSCVLAEFRIKAHFLLRVTLGVCVSFSMSPLSVVVTASDSNAAVESAGIASSATTTSATTITAAIITANTTIVALATATPLLHSFPFIHPFSGH